MSSLELQKRILVEISEVYVLALGADVWVLFDHEPAHMCEEEPTTSIMGVSLGLGELVVDSVVTGPLDQIILEGNAVAEHKEDSEWGLCLVGPVCPESVGSCCHSQTRQEVQDVCKEESLILRAGEGHVEPYESGHMKHHEGVHVPPDHLRRRTLLGELLLGLLHLPLLLILDR